MLQILYCPKLNLCSIVESHEIKASSKCYNNWLSTIDEQRRQLLFIFDDSPSLEKIYLATVFNKCYQMARKLASKETQLSVSKFPESCPFSPSKIFDIDFYP
ncbi:DUF29 domain-containing protein [Nodularia sp. LEGE 06071]|uniref:DUF29 domain-containing protein n=1 Tax=unclassified Nodularia (in: cyanobacteria) TaxID=2656917 RepID=UPI00187E4504|nr:DUF29 domain-containing protein [Nodularia sp. LEGE 06071]MCC2692394.1 DUF29 domain-containing protein [Nodularia sp. LEGE 04288]